MMNETENNRRRRMGISRAAGTATRADLFDAPGYKNLSADSNGNPCVWLNYYFCDTGHVMEEWNDMWSSQCDDECPVCGRSVSPLNSAWIGPGDTVDAEWLSLPEKQ